MKALESTAAAVALVSAGACLAAAPVQTPGASAVATAAPGACGVPASLGLVELPRRWCAACARRCAPCPCASAWNRPSVRTASTWANPSVHYGASPRKRKWASSSPAHLRPVGGCAPRPRGWPVRPARPSGRPRSRRSWARPARRFAQLLLDSAEAGRQTEAMAQLDQAVKIVQGQIGRRPQPLRRRARGPAARADAGAARAAAPSPWLRAACAQLLAQPNWSPRPWAACCPRRWCRSHV